MCIIKLLIMLSYNYLIYNQEFKSLRQKFVSQRNSPFMGSPTIFTTAYHSYHTNLFNCIFTINIDVHLQ